MPRVIDQFPGQRGAGASSLYSPTRNGLPYQNPTDAIDTTSTAAGELVRANLVATIKEKTGIDLTGVVEFFDWMSAEIGFSIHNLGEQWDALIAQVTQWINDLIDGIWKGVGGLGDVLDNIFNPDHAKAALEETQRRIAAAVAQIMGIGGTTVNFAELPPGPNLSGWRRTRISGSTGTLVVRDRMLKIVDDVGFGGSRWRAIYTDKMAADADVRVDAVFGTVPGFLSGAQNRIIAKCNDAGDHVFADLMYTRGEIGLNIDGRESILKGPIPISFSPATTYSLVVTGSTLRLLSDGQQKGDPVVDSRVPALTGRMVGAEFSTPITLDPAGGLSALGFRTPAPAFL